MLGDSNNITEIQKTAEMELKLAEYEGGDKVVSSHEMQQILVDKPQNVIKFDSGFPTLDALIEGFEGGELVVVSGLTKHGKTTWCQSLTKNLVKENIGALWFSYEMPVNQFLRKFSQENMPLFYLPLKLREKNVKWIEERIWEATLKYGVKAIFIDHLHFLVDLIRLRNPSIEIGSIVRLLKSIAIRHNVVVFLIAHLMKIKSDKVPSVEDLRDSSFIAQDSDSVIIIHRKEKEHEFGQPTEYRDEARLTVHTHRRTGVMGKSVELKMKDGFLVEPIQDLDLPEPPPLVHLQQNLTTNGETKNVDDLPF